MLPRLLNKLSDSKKQSEQTPAENGDFPFQHSEIPDKPVQSTEYSESPFGSDEQGKPEKPSPDFYAENGMIVCNINGNRTKDQSIKILNLTAETYNILVNADVKNISQLIDMTIEQLRSINNLGIMAEGEILKKLYIFLVNFKEKSIIPKPADTTPNNLPEESPSGTDESADNIEYSVTGNAEEPVSENTAIQKNPFNRQTHIQNLPLSARSKNTLCRAGIMNLEQLMEYSNDELSKIRNLGAKSFQEIIDFKNSINPEKTALKSPVPENNESAEKIPFIKTDIWNLPLSVRSKNALCRNGIIILEQLMNLNNNELKKFHSLGAKSFKEIVDYKEEIADHLFDDLFKTTDASEEKKEICEKFISELEISQSQADKIRPYCFRIITQDKTDDELLRELYEETNVNDVLRKKVFRLLSENQVFGVRLSDIRAVLPDNLPEDIFMDILNDTAQKDHGKRYILKSVSSSELLENDEKIGENGIEIIKSRLSGKTLAETAEQFKVTRERIRQKQEKILDRINKKSAHMKKSLSENRFKPLFEKYSFDEKLFCTLTEQPPETFMFLKITTYPGKKSIPDMFKEVQLPEWIIRNWEKYCRESDNSNYLYIEADKRLIEKSRYGIEIYLMSKYCRDEMLFDDFVALYQDFLKKHCLENDTKLRITENEKRSQENQISRSRYALWKYGKKFRYYDVAANDYTDLLSELNLEQYQNTEISTLKLFRDHHELMKEYDIRDEYELHNLLKKIGFGKNDPDIQWYMPHIRFGEFEREDMIKDYMLRLAPISVEKLAEAISEDYGFKPEMIINHFSCIDEYYKDGIYTVDFEAMTEEQLQLLSDNLTDDFYYLKEIEDKFSELFPDSNTSLANSFNIKKMGFIVHSTYAIKNHRSAAEYFGKLFTQNDVTDISNLSKRYSVIMQYYSVLSSLKDDYTIIEFEPHQYINIRKLENMGIDKSRLRNYCDEVYDFTRNITYFTVESLQKKGFISALDNLGFEPWFYSSLLREDDRFTYNKIGGTVLFDTKRCEVSTQALILHIVSEFKSIEIDELIEYIKEKFCITLDKDNLKWRIKNTELYFDEIMQKVYDEYSTYYEEIMSIDDEE